MKNKKSLFARLLACMLVLVMVFSLAACGGGDDSNNPGGGDNNPGGGTAEGTAQRFEAEYATISGSVPGLVSVFFGASNNCWLSPIENSSNGYAVGNAYIEGNDDNIPAITWTITSDADAEATIVLGVGPTWHSDASFNTIYEDTDVNAAYPLTVNGTAVTTSASMKASDAVTTGSGDEVVINGSCFVAVNYGTVQLKAGENTIVMTATADSSWVDYLEITTTANLTMTEDHSHTYRVYSEEDFEFVEVAV